MSEAMKKQIVMIIEGMHCTNCVMQLEGIEDRLAGVERVEASYHKGQMKVVYDDSKVNEAQIRSEVQRLGFEVTKGNSL
jgi:copper chaperone CopZ